MPPKMASRSPKPVAKAAPVRKMRTSNSEGAKSPMAKVVGNARSASVNRGQQGARMRSSNSEGASSPMARKLPASPAKSGGGLDLGKFAREVSTNYGRGVAEVGRQLGSVKVTNPLDRAGRKDPLAGKTVQNAVDFGSRTNASNNPLKRILKK